MGMVFARWFQGFGVSDVCFGLPCARSSSTRRETRLSILPCPQCSGEKIDVSPRGQHPQDPNSHMVTP